MTTPEQTSNSSAGDAYSKEVPSRSNTYFVDPENVAEMGRLIVQDRFVTRLMGGLFPADFDTSDIHQVLDLACGPGAWVRDVAAANPTMQVTGVDISQLMTEFAINQTREMGLVNARFRIMDILKSFDYPDHSFDYINARMLTPLVGARFWPQLVQECWRVLRPGGFLRMTECEQWFNSNSAALYELQDLAIRTSQLSPYHLGSPNLRSPTPLLTGCFRKAGFQDLKQQAYVLDQSYGSDAYADGLHNIMTITKLTQPFMVRLGVATQEELELLRERVLADMQSEDFCALVYYYSIWGQKPLT